MTTISAIVPAYNAERTILKTIESIRQQTYKNLEIIVINDGSSDRTLELLESVRDERLKVYSYKNGGLPTARNRGISRATGDYISFIDADDLWTKDKLEKQLLALQQNPQAGVAYSWVICMVQDPENPDKITFVPEQKSNLTGNIYPDLLLGNFIGNGSNILARREAIESVGEFKPTLKSCEDWDYYLRLAAKWEFVLVPDSQILYLKTAGTMTSKAHIMETEGLRVLERVYQTMPAELKSLKNKSLANFAWYCGGLYLNHSSDVRDLAQARARFWQAIRLDPTILRQKDSYVLLVKLLLKQALPNNLVNNLISLLKKPFLVSDPR
ncbi:MAG TPA: glycosyltransferase [Coleofasciculaceae cyanobacterium]|jgi:glycosyltransferase involved in cell wall biosynthesis